MISVNNSAPARVSDVGSSTGELILCNDLLPLKNPSWHQPLPLSSLWKMREIPVNNSGPVWVSNVGSSTSEHILAIYLSRGNHESRCMNKIYGFQREVKTKMNEMCAELFADVFCYLPLAHVINHKVFVVHGGLFSVDGVKLSDIKAIDRVCEPPEEGLMCELLWSDPQPQLGRGPSKRGVGLSFGEDVTERFLQDNNLDLVVRSHEVKDEGYEIEHGGKLITVFSAPNYCDQMGNKGAFIRFKAPELTPDIVTFSAVPHPDVKPMAYANSSM